MTRSNASRRAPPLHLEPRNRAPLRNTNFLVIEDDPALGPLLKRLLQSVGAERTRLDSDPRGAIAAISNPIDVPTGILADFDMKPINGLQVLQAVRMGLNPVIPRDLPFVLVTGHANNILVEKAAVLDAHGYIIKPASIGKIVAAVQRALKTQISLKLPKEYGSVVTTSAQMLAS